MAYVAAKVGPSFLVLALVDLFDAPRWLIVAAAVAGPLFGGAAGIARLVAHLPTRRAPATRTQPAGRS